nr:restriction endonuclease subunit S [Acinetobacter sp. WY4]
MTTPKLRFKEFNGDWDINHLGDSFSLFSGYAFPSTASSDKGVRWLKIADVGIQEMTPNNMSFLPEEYLEKYSQFVVDKNDYVIALTRPILNKKLKISKVGEMYHGALLNQRVAKIVSKNNNLNFIYSLLQKSKTVEELENSISGTDPPNLSLNDVKDIRLGFPSIKEQTKIATFLSAVDEKISQLTQKHQLLSQYKQGMMQKLFSQQLRFKADDRSEFGKWEEKKIGDIFKVTSGATPLRSDERFFKDADIDWVKTTDLNNGKILQTEEKISQFALKETSVKILPKGTVFVAMYGGFNQIGRTGLLVKEAACNQALSAIYPNEKINSYFLLTYFNYKVLDWKNFAASSRKDPNITKSDVLAFPFIYPTDLEEQTKIANFLSSIDQKIEVVTQQIEQAKTWKKGLLQQMFV